MDTSSLIGLLVAAVALLIIAASEIYYLKKDIRELEENNKLLIKRLDRADIKEAGYLDQIKWLRWQIQNPPKYKKGEKFGDLIITSYKLNEPTLWDFIAKGIMGFISICAGSVPEKMNLNRYYEYELTHTLDGGKKKMSEKELTNFVPAAK